jgi:hypothetical protein
LDDMLLMHEYFYRRVFVSIKTENLRFSETFPFCATGILEIT